MIRRKLSSGVLRASKSSGSLRSTAIAQAHAVPVAQTQTAGLASATLLSSQRNWGKETVVTLKNELKKRGLSQAGAKAVLVDRIKSAEMSAMLPPMPSTPAPTAQSSSFTRQLSTSATASAAKKRSRSASQPTAPASDESTSTNEPVTSTGPEVVSQRTEAPKTEPLSPEELSVAPGLPETKGTESAKSSSFGVEIPTPKVPEEAEQIIPVEPDNFRAKAIEEPEPTSSAPKVVTVASASTHHGGGPTHAIHEATDPHSIETKEGEEDTSVDISGLTSALSSAFGAPGRALKSSGISGSLPSIGAAQGFEKKQGEYKPNDKPLSGEEKTGVWIFGGIVSLGLLLGGGKKKKDKSIVDEAKAKLASVKGGVQGDEKWAQASGAGIVGHGARKD